MAVFDAQAKAGPAAWDYWAQVLASGEAKRDHHTYNLGLWLECREMGIDFLQEAREQLPGRCDAALDEATEHYAAVCDGLRGLLALHPEREEPNWGPDSTFSSPEAAALVRQVGEADGQGLDCLREIVECLSP